MKDGFVPNNYYASELHHLNIVTGCNMSGKSTYLRGVALLQIMAQIGCFVPAEYASFSVVHSIFARVTFDDSIEANMSTFSVEMREMAFILRLDPHAENCIAVVLILTVTSTQIASPSLMSLAVEPALAMVSRLR
jgi:DNA mismatch repair ATPase MutS